MFYSRHTHLWLALLASTSLQAATGRDLPELPHASMQMQAKAQPGAAVKLLQSQQQATSPMQRGPGTELYYDLDIQYVDGQLFNPSTQQYDATRLRALTGSVTSKAVPYIGPVVDLYPGETFRLTLNNKLDPKDPSCPSGKGAHNGGHCFNTTNMHTHGLWISPSGNSDNVLLSIKPGVSFQYEYNIPVDHPAGTFWYHPHLHGSTALQVSSGMAGPLIIRGTRYPKVSGNLFQHGDLDTLLQNPKASSPQPIRERVLVFQQIAYACREPGSNGKPGAILVDKQGNWVCKPGSQYPSEKVGQIEAYDQFGVADNNTVWNQSGRYTSINGVVMPNFRQVKAGALERWRLVHAGVRDSINLQFRKAIPQAMSDTYQPGSLKARAEQVDRVCQGGVLPQFSVASDGLTRAAVTLQEKTLLQPGYREDLLMVFPSPGIYCVIDSDLDPSQTVDTQEHSRELLGYIEVVAGDTGTDLAKVKEDKLNSALEAWVKDWLLASADRFMPADVKPQITKDLQDGLKLSAFVDHPSVKAAEVTGSQTLGFNIDTKAKPVRFEIGNLSQNAATGKYQLADASPYSVATVNRVLTLGGVDEWTLTSFLAGHPFHIHVNPFQVVSVQKCGKTSCTQPGDWQDLTQDPASQYYGMAGRWRDTLFVEQDVVVKTRTRYQRYIGEYVLHCHILDHEDEGMMQNVMVALPDGQGGVAAMGHH